MNHSNPSNRSKNNPLVGLIIIFFGVLLLLENLLPNVYFFDKIFSWPIILILVGLFIGNKSGYHKPAPYILITVGTLFFILRLFHIHFNALFWPIILISIGFHLISSRNKKKHRRPWPPSPDPEEDVSYRVPYSESSDRPGDFENVDYTDFTEIKEENGSNLNQESQTQSNQDQGNQGPYKEAEQKGGEDYPNDYIDSTSVFGSNKIKVVSRNFKGGNVVNIFGGAEINLLHADIKHPAEIETIQLFGGCTLIAPPHWVIKTEMTSFFGGAEDKRYNMATPDNRKVLYIKGTSLFGGVTIKSS